MSIALHLVHEISKVIHRVYLSHALKHKCELSISYLPEDLLLLRDQLPYLTEREVSMAALEAARGSGAAQFLVGNALKNGNARQVELSIRLISAAAASSFGPALLLNQEKSSPGSDGRG